MLNYSQVVQFTIDDFCTTESVFLDIHNGPDDNDPVILHHSGCTTPVLPVTSSGQYMYIYFYTKSSGPWMRGFEATVECIQGKQCTL